MLLLRQKLFFFAGLNISLYGLALLILGAWGTRYWVHGAAGVPMWAGIFLIMCGVWDIIIAIDQNQKQTNTGLSFSSFLVNIFAVIMGIFIIGFSTWAAWSVLDRGIKYGSPAAGGTEPQIELYITVLLLGIFSAFLGLVCLMVDCCAETFASPTPDYGAAAAQFGNAGFGGQLGFGGAANYPTAFQTGF